MVNAPLLPSPDQMQIIEEQKRIRLEQAESLKRQAQEAAVPRRYGESITFRLRQIRNGSFNGLWELCILDERGKVDRVLTDADALQNAIETVGNVMENRGY